jgi:hypothetical protein
MAYLNLALLILFVLSPRIIPVVVTVLHGVKTWRHGSDLPLRRQRALQLRGTRIRPVPVTET